MPPHLRVLAGTSDDPYSPNLTPITHLVNTTRPFKLVSENFEGEVVVNIKGLEGHAADSGYFERSDRKGVTWSIQVRGRFLHPISADNVLFGNTFDRPLHLPWGSSAALKFMHYVDPTLTHDLTSPTKPWALSPLISTMPHFAHSRSPPMTSLGNIEGQPSFPPAESITDDTSQLHLACIHHTTSNNNGTDDTSGSSDSMSNPNSSTSSLGSDTLPVAGATDTNDENQKQKKQKRSTKSRKGARKMNGTTEGGLGLHDAAQRRTYFSDPVRRKEVVFGPEDIITTDFCYGFLEFTPSLALRLPGGISFDLMKYWDGQPVRFVCCRRKDAVSEDGCDGMADANSSDDPWGPIFWCVAIEMSDSSIRDEEGSGEVLI